MNANKLEAILNAATGMNYMEWRMMAEMIERQFEMKRNQLVMTMQDAQEIAGRLRAEQDRTFA